MDVKELKKVAEEMAEAVEARRNEECRNKVRINDERRNDECRKEKCRKDNAASTEFDDNAHNETCGVNAVEDSKNIQTGKFKNPKELLRAYCQLEKEFTKRSQRLAKLEEELQQTKSGSFENSAENFLHGNSDDDRERNSNDDCAGNFADDCAGNFADDCAGNFAENFQLTEQESAEQKKAVFENEEEWKAAVDKFFEKTPSAKAFAKDIAKAILDDPDLKADVNCLNIALTRVLLDKFRTPEQLMSDGQFLEKYVFASQAVQDGIITRYLDGLLAGKPPYTLTAGGMQCVAPQKRPKSIEEAGLMFLKNND